MKILIKGLIVLMIVSVLFAGCIEKKEEVKGQSLNDTRTIKYIEDRQPLITKEDFPDFGLVEHVHFVTSDNLTVSLYTEASHGGFVINGSDNISEGFRVYGSSETHNSSQRYLLLQYKVFDDGDGLNDSMNITVIGYIRDGFTSKVLNDSKYVQRMFILDSSVENINNRKLENINKIINAMNDTNGTNATNITRLKNIAKNLTLSDKDKNMNITYILFGYDTIIGRIAVKDSKDKSLDESLKILDITLERLRIGTKNVTMNTSAFRNMDAGNKSINGTNKINNTNRTGVNY